MQKHNALHIGVIVLLMYCARGTHGRSTLIQGCSSNISCTIVVAPSNSGYAEMALGIINSATAADQPPVERDPKTPFPNDVRGKGRQGRIASDTRFQDMLVDLQYRIMARTDEETANPVYLEAVCVLNGLILDGTGESLSRQEVAHILDLAHQLYATTDLLDAATAETLLKFADAELDLVENVVDVDSIDEEILAHLLMSQGTLAKSLGNYEMAEHAFSRFIVIESWKGYGDWALGLAYDRLFRTYLLQGNKSMAACCLRSMKGFIRDVDAYKRREEFVEKDTWKSDMEFFQKW